MVEAVCDQCGIHFHKGSALDKNLCPDHRGAVLTPKPIAPLTPAPFLKTPIPSSNKAVSRTCYCCGEQFKPTCNAQKRCAGCGEEAEAQRKNVIRHRPGSNDPKASKLMKEIADMTVAEIEAEMRMMRGKLAKAQKIISTLSELVAEFNL